MKRDKAKHEAEFFKKHIIDKKSMKQCAEAMSATRQQLCNYKKDENFRQKAIEFMESGGIDGIKGVVEKLTEHCNSDNQNISFKATQEAIKIYGLEAPKRKDVTATISLSPNEELFRQIDEAQDRCRFVESVETGSGSLSVVEGQQGFSTGNFEKRQRALLQNATVQES